MAKTTHAQTSKQPVRTGVPINIRLPPELHDALTAFRGDQRVKPGITDTVELAIQEFLQREGYWPAKKTE